MYILNKKLELDEKLILFAIIIYIYINFIFYTIYIHDDLIII